MNICSAIVYIRPGQGRAVQHALEQFTGVEVHGGAAEGKLIVTLEDAGDDGLAATMNRFNDLPGVIQTSMIYHHSGIESPDQEVAK